MDQLTTSIISSLAINYFSDFSGELVKNFFKKAIKEKPEIEEELKTAKSSYDFEKIFKEATGIIDASANSDEIKVFGGFLNALKGIRFNHGSGGSVAKLEI